MICKNCGIKITEGTTICPECGCHLNEYGAPIENAETEETVSGVTLEETPNEKHLEKKRVSDDRLTSRKKEIENNDRPEKDKDQKEHKKANARYAVIISLLVVIAIATGFLGFEYYRQSHSTSLFDSSRRVLIVRTVWNSEDYYGDYSDWTMISNALDDGGMIVLNRDELVQNNDGTFSVPTIMLRERMSVWGASDVYGSYYVDGALLNYIASEGWELVSTEGQYYYFRR